MRVTIRDARQEDCEAMLALLPRLASFAVPPWRQAEHLWRGDASLLRQWFAGQAPRSFAQVAVADDGEVLGLTLVSFREELLSREPSAHLEVIAVTAHAERRGIGSRLIQSAEDRAAEGGALSMALNVFSNNAKARSFYQSAGYDGELIRYIKPIAKHGIRE